MVSNGVLYSRLQLNVPKLKLTGPWVTEDLGDGHYLIKINTLEEFCTVDSGSLVTNFELASPDDPPYKMYIFVFQFEASKKFLNDLEFYFNLELNSTFFIGHSFESLKTFEPALNGNLLFIKNNFVRNYLKLPCSQIDLNIFYRGGLFNKICYLKLTDRDKILQIITLLHKTCPYDFKVFSNLIQVELKNGTKFKKLIKQLK
mgnify:FL=1